MKRFLLIVCLMNLMCGSASAQNMNVRLKDGSIIRYEADMLDQVDFDTLKAPVADALSNTENRIYNYWFKENSLENGFDEIHIVARPSADAFWGAVDPDSVLLGDISEKISCTFAENKVVLSSYVQNDFDDPYTTSFVFAPINIGKVYKGYGADGQVTDYTLSISSDELTLYASNNSKREAVAFLSSPGEGIDNQAISLNKESAFAKSLLNYEQMNVNPGDSDYFKAIVEMKVHIGHSPVKCNNNIFAVRFFRPLYPQGRTVYLVDATYSRQRIELRDLLDLSEWNKVSFADYPSCWNYYNIKSVKVAGVKEDGSIDGCINTEVYSGNNTFSRTSCVPHGLSFKVNYSTPLDKKVDSYGYITYTNDTSVVNKFNVMIPLVIEYEWGKIYTECIIRVVQTLEW